MIFRDLVGGGGSAKSSFVITGLDAIAIAGRFRDKSAGDGGDTGLYDESEAFPDGVEELLLNLSTS